MAKKGGLFGKLLGAAAVAGAAKVVSDLEKKAKEEGKDILDVAKDKVDDLVEDVKSGELQDELKAKVEDLVEDVKDGDFEKTVNGLVDNVKSGEFVKNLEEKAKDIIADVQTEEFKEKATETLTNLKDGVVDLIDGKDQTLL